MFPLLTFAAGLVTGAASIRLLKSIKAPDKLREATASGVEAVTTTARDQYGRVETGLRKATVSSLSAIERSSASLRAKLEAEPAVVAEPVEAQSQDSPAAPAKARTRAKPKAKPVAEAETKPKAAAKPRRAPRKIAEAPAEGGSEPKP